MRFYCFTKLLAYMTLACLLPVIRDHCKQRCAQSKDLRKANGDPDAKKKADEEAEEVRGT